VSDNQASSSNYLIPVVLIVLAVITSILFSQLYLQDGADSEVDAVSEKRSEKPGEEPTVATAEQPQSDDSSPNSPDNPDQSASEAELVAETGSEPDQPVIAEQEQEQEQVQQEQQEQQAEKSGIPAIADLTLLAPANDALCDGQNPWGEGDRALSESAGTPGCYGLRFELAKPATVLLLKLSEGAAPRSLLAESCRPFGFSSARFEQEQVQRLPRGMNAQPGVFRVGPTPARTRFVLVAALQPQDQLTDLETGVANLCGQSATLTNAQVQTQLDALGQLEDVSVKEVQGKL
jgi:hypothetical protein